MIPIPRSGKTLTSDSNKQYKHIRSLLTDAKERTQTMNQAIVCGYQPETYVNKGFKKLTHIGLRSYN